MFYSSPGTGSTGAKISCTALNCMLTLEIKCQAFIQSQAFAAAQNRH